MSEFVEVKTAELTGPALDYAVAVAMDLEIRRGPGFIAVGGCYGYVWREGGAHKDYSWAPSTNWSQGGTLIELCCEMCRTAEGEWMAVVPHPSDGRLMICYDSSLLVAMCRAIVEAYLGGMVQVPSELVGIK